MHHMFTGYNSRNKDVLLKTLTYSSSIVATHREHTEEKAVTKNMFRH